MCLCDKCKNKFEEVYLFWIKTKAKYILVCEKCKKSISLMISTDMAQF